MRILRVITPLMCVILGFWGSRMAIHHQPMTWWFLGYVVVVIVIAGISGSLA